MPAPRFASTPKNASVGGSLRFSRRGGRPIGGRCSSVSPLAGAPAGGGAGGAASGGFPQEGHEGEGVEAGRRNAAQHPAAAGGAPPAPAARAAQAGPAGGGARHQGHRGHERAPAAGGGAGQQGRPGEDERAPAAGVGRGVRRAHPARVGGEELGGGHTGDVVRGAPAAGGAVPGVGGLRPPGQFLPHRALQPAGASKVNKQINKSWGIEHALAVIGTGAPSLARETETCVYLAGVPHRGATGDYPGAPGVGAGHHLAGDQRHQAGPGAPEGKGDDSPLSPC
eukprot:1195502-Prorocentrum_minimum.AAC.2